jgi:5'-nucleotidase
MNSSRRIFLSRATVAAGAVVLAKRINPVSLACKTVESSAGAENSLTVYHTNGINGNVGPVYKNVGGLRKINTYITNEAGAGLLLDAGNFLTPCGSPDEQKQLVLMMNNTGYKAAGISGLDLSDNGRLLTGFNPLMQFSLINCNHRFTAEVKPLIKPYQLFKNGGIKIGITAVCAPVKGAAYKNAFECANRTARFLKEQEHCHLVICLSDLGPAGRNPELNDQMLAEKSEHIDLIIGNDYGKFHNNDMVMRNKLKHEVIFSAAAASGLTIGKTVVNFGDDKTKKSLAIEHIIPGKPANQKFGAAMRELSLA